MDAKMVHGFVELAHFRWDMVRLNHTKSTNTTGWRHLVCMCVFHLVLGWNHLNVLEKGWQQLQTTGSSTTAVQLDESNGRKVINHGAAWHFPKTDFLRERFLVYFRNAQDLQILSAYSFSFSIQTFKPVLIDSMGPSVPKRRGFSEDAPAPSLLSPNQLIESIATKGGMLACAMWVCLELG